VDVPRPAPIPAFGGVQIASIAAGGSHSAAVSRDGAAYAWGCGLDGALGAGTAQKGDPLFSMRRRRLRSSQSGSLSQSPPPPGLLGRRHSLSGTVETSAAGAGAVVAMPSGLGASSAVPLLMEGPGLDDEDVVQVGGFRP
jgi:hypothetical protein